MCLAVAICGPGDGTRVFRAAACQQIVSLRRKGERGRSRHDFGSESNSDASCARLENVFIIDDVRGMGASIFQTFPSLSLFARIFPIAFSDYFQQFIYVIFGIISNFEYRKAAKKINSPKLFAAQSALGLLFFAVAMCNRLSSLKLTFYAPERNGIRTNFIIKKMCAQITVRVTRSSLRFLFASSSSLSFFRAPEKEIICM